MSVPGAAIGKSAWQFQRTPIHVTSSSSGPLAPSQPLKTSSTPKTMPLMTPKTAPAAECLPKTCVAPSMRGLFAFEYFNKMQSRCFPALYDGTDNCVIGAPTAAGKTICFELALAAFFAPLSRPSPSKQAYSSSNMSACAINGPQATVGVSGDRPIKKALYLAPLKSLVQERLKDWTTKLHPLGIRCQELSGDSGEELVKDCDLYVSTPEKWDAITRRWKEYADTLERIGLIMVDEVHLLGDERGAVLEAVIARCLSMATSGQVLPRIVALSASSPNVRDIGKWINAPEQNIFFFGDEHRPITPRYVSAYQSHICAHTHLYASPFEIMFCYTLWTVPSEESLTFSNFCEISQHFPTPWFARRF